MRLLLSQFLSLWFLSASAKLCSFAREFAVDNCTACPTLDQTRGEIPMAICEKRAAGTGDGAMVYAYVCVCGNFPASGLVSALRYYPHNEGNGTRCKASWDTAPRLYTFLSVLSVGVMLYTAAHFFYISLLSRICCCSRHGCTKVNAAALSLGVAELFYLANPLWRIVTLGEIAIDDSSTAQHGGWLAYWFTGLVSCALFVQCLAQAFLYTSIFDVAYPGEDKTGLRCCANTSLWVLAGLTALSSLFSIVPLIRGDVGGWTGELIALILTGLNGVQLLFSTVFIVRAHKTMHEVSLDPASCGVFASIFLYITCAAGGAEALVIRKQASAYRQNG